MSDRSPHNVHATHECGYWHGRNGFARMASDAEYQRGYRAGVEAAAKAPAPPHCENDALGGGK